MTQLIQICMNDNYFTGSIPSGLIQNARPNPFNGFDVSKNRLNLCLLPSNASVTPNFAITCKVGSQAPIECGCPDKWPVTCTANVAMNDTCPPETLEPLAPFYVAPLPPDQSLCPYLCPNSTLWNETCPQDDPPSPLPLDPLPVAPSIEPTPSPIPSAPPTAPKSASASPIKAKKPPFWAWIILAIGLLLILLLVLLLLLFLIRKKKRSG